MNGLGKPLGKKSDPKNQKKKQSEIARNRISIQTAFSHSTLKLELNNSRRKITRFFRSTFCFG